MYVDGKWVEAVSGGVRTVYNPASGEPLATVADGDALDADRAVRAARRAFDEPGWSDRPAAERARLLFKLADLIEEQAEGLARLDTLNCGKPIREARYDAADAAGCCRYYAGLVTKPLGQTYAVPDGSVAMVVREPIGVAAQIIPWNYPLLMAAWKLAPALAAGNTCVLKPSEHTPLSALRLAELIEEVGFPPGVVNIVLGDGPRLGAPLAAHPQLDKVAFTGGTATGRSIMKAAAEGIKKVSLELGGKSPNIVFADCDLEPTVEYAMFGIFAGSGQVCSAGSRLLLEESIADRFLDRLVARSSRIKLGPGLNEDTEMGPLITPQHWNRVDGYVRWGLEEGADLVLGGQRPDDPALAGGNFYAPTIFARTRSDMKVVQEEIFGPVLVVQTFKDEDEAVRLANDTVYGLAGAVQTTDLAKAHRVIRRLRAGITWINTYHPTYNEAPWGGYKQSGIGRELGTFGLEAYTEIKQININMTPGPLGWYAG